jgi:hypothetical protein
MIFGRPIWRWIVMAFVAVCVFILAKWLIPLVFALVSIAVPEQISTILALLVAVGVLCGGYRYPVTP